MRQNLSSEAIRLTRLVQMLLPDPEVMGLLALMLLHESRRAARTDAHGDIILLEQQQRELWDQHQIEEGVALVQQSLASGRFGFYTLQAAISAVHAQSRTPADTDWNQIVALYSILLQLEPSPVIELNRAVAIAMRDGPQAGVQIVDDIFARGELADYHLAHSTRGELLQRAGLIQPAIKAFERALQLVKQIPEQRMLQRKIEQLRLL